MPNAECFVQQVLNIVIRLGAYTGFVRYRPVNFIIIIVKAVNNLAC